MNALILCLVLVVVLVFGSIVNLRSRRNVLKSSVGQDILSLQFQLPSDHRSLIEFPALRFMR